MSVKKNRKRSDRKMLRNRLFYFCLTVVILTLAWVYGGRMLYMTFYTLVSLPVLSALYLFVALRGLRIVQRPGQSAVVKGEPAYYKIHVYNRTPLIHENIRCLFIDDHFALEIDRELNSFFARPFMRGIYRLELRVRYRGEYNIGLRGIEADDFLGIVTLRRKVKGSFSLTVYPRVVETKFFPLATLLSHSHSNYEIREEDYANVSDVRQYQEEDSMKRVHWKLSARRSELMVKNFQSNALNHISIMVNTGRKPLTREEALVLEDRMIETALSVVHYCLRQRMPVSFYIGEGLKTEGRQLADFDALYNATETIRFDDTLDRSLANGLLEYCLSDSTSGYLNVVAATARLDSDFCERVIKATLAGHYIVVLYFVPARFDHESELMYDLLVNGNIDVYRITADAKAEEAA